MDFKLSPNRIFHPWLVPARALFLSHIFNIHPTIFQHLYSKQYYCFLNWQEVWDQLSRGVCFLLYHLWWAYIDTIYHDFLNDFVNLSHNEFEFSLDLSEWITFWLGNLKWCWVPFIQRTYLRVKKYHKHKVLIWDHCFSCYLLTKYRHILF